MHGFHIDPESIDGNSHVLVELAALLHEGTLDGNVATMARAPRAHVEVGDQVEKFARFTHDQYQDLVALLGALATRLKAAGEEHVAADSRVQDELSRFLRDPGSVPPGEW